MRKGSLYLVALATMILVSCSSQSRSFDSREWRIGRSSLRGTMVQDLIDSGAPVGAQSDVEGLSGSPDYREKFWYGYRVITIPRCRFWECRLDVGFDATRDRVVSVALGD